MPRPKGPTPRIDRAPLNHEVLAGDSRAIDADASRRKEIAERFGDGTPYERTQVVGQLRFHLQAGALAMLESGKCLIRIKESEEHGDFLKIVDELGLSPRTAQNMMGAAVKFLLPAGTKGRERLLALPQTKLYDLAILDEDDVKELAKGKTVAGLTIDDVDAMSSRELRAHLRESRAQLDAKDRVIEGKDKKINKLLEHDAGLEPFKRAFEKALAINSEAFDKLQLACAEVARVAERISEMEFPGIDDEKGTLALRAQIANHFFSLSEFWLEQGAGLVVAARGDHVEALLAHARKRLPEDVKAKIFQEGA